MDAPMIRAEAVHKRYGLLEVLKGITLEVAPREVMCLLGAFRFGQVDLPALHQPPREDQLGSPLRGRLARRLRGTRRALHELREREVCRRRTEIGMVFQRFNLFLT